MAPSLYRWGLYSPLLARAGLGLTAAQAKGTLLDGGVPGHGQQAPVYPDGARLGHDFKKLRAYWISSWEKANNSRP
jgi:hypothetical protein